MYIGAQVDPFTEDEKRGDGGYEGISCSRVYMYVRGAERSPRLRNVLRVTAGRL